MQAVTAITAVPTTAAVPAIPAGASPPRVAPALTSAPARLDGAARPRPAGGVRRAGRTYRELAAWQRAVELCVACHELAARLPSAEAEGLGRSICEAAGTLAANVAQGHERLLRADYVQHLSIARGTLQRIETLLEVAHRLRYLDVAEAAALDRRCASVGRHLSQLIRAVYGVAGGTTRGVADRAGRREG